MYIGIVGSEAAKFTPETEAKARKIIVDLIVDWSNETGELVTVVSGGCHLGGVDVYAREEADAANVGLVEFFPKTRKWEGGYKQRNLEIAKLSDRVYCITVRKIPDSYHGMRFSKCYHCNTDQHVKSGGCWTVKQAIKMGKPGEIIVVD